MRSALVLLAFGCRSSEPQPDPGSTTPVPSTPSTLPDDVTAFVGVEVLTMDVSEPVLHDRTVLVHDGRILDLVDASTPLPEGATIIEGEGRFLMPGLIDAHAHVWYEGELTLLVANGVTATRNLFGDPLQRGWRDAIAAGEQFGPTLVTAGPIVDGSPPSWPTSDVVLDAADAARVVADQLDQGYDLIKVYNSLDRASWEAILAEAAAVGATVAGHVPWAVGWDDVVASDQYTIEHLDGLVDVVGASPVPISLYDTFALNAALDQLDDGRLQAAAERAASDGVILVPTLVVIDKFASAAETAVWAADPVMQYVHPDVVASWTASPALPPGYVSTFDRYAVAVTDFTRVLYAAGARIALGTDANNPWVIPGFSVHEELRLLVAAGLTPEEALVAGTVTAAAAIQRPELGTVAVGQRADLLLLDADPRLDVANVQARVGVMLGGEWFSEEELQGRLADLAAEYASLRSAPGAARFTGCH